MQYMSAFLAPLSTAASGSCYTSPTPFKCPQVCNPPPAKPHTTRCSVTDAVPSLSDTIQKDIATGALRKAVNRLEEAVNNQTTPLTPVVTYHHFHALIHQAALKRQWEVAMRTFYALERTGHFCVRSTSSHLFDVLTRAGRIAECDQILSQLWSRRLQLYDGRETQLTERQMQRRRPDEKMVTQIANAAVHNGRPDIAIDMVKNMEAHGVLMSVFTVSVMIKAYGRQGNHEGITQVLAALNRRDLAPDLILFNSAIDAYVRCGERGLASLVLKEIVRRGLKPNARTFNPILKGLARAGKIEEMNSLRKEMERRGVRPSGYTFNAVISAYVKQGEWDNAGKALKELERLDDGEAGRDLAVGYTTVISGLAAEGRVANALRILEAMVHRKGSAFEEEVGVACTALLSAMLQRGEIVNAWKLFRGVRQRFAIRLPVDMYCAVIRGLAKRGDAVALDAAEKVFDEMMDVFGEDGDGTGSVSKKKKRAASTVGEARPADIALAYNAMIDGYVRCGDTTTGERVLDRMEDQGHVPTTTSYTILVNGYGKELDMLSAKRLFRRMRKSGIRPDRVAMNAFLGAHVRVGDMDTAVRLFEEMQRYAGAISPDLITFSAMIAGYVSQKKTSEAWDLYEEMKGIGIVPNERLLERMMAAFVSTDLKPSRGEVWGLDELEDGLLSIEKPVEIEVVDSDNDVVRNDASDEGRQLEEESEWNEENYAEKRVGEESDSRQWSGFDVELDQILATDSGWASKRAQVLLKDMHNCKCSEMNKKRWHHAIRSLWIA